MLVGVDEAGRGCIAGPVVAAAVSLTDLCDLTLLKDSKTLSASQRELAFNHLKEATPFIGIGILSHTYIDQTNILKATLLAMKLAIKNLNTLPKIVLIDGNRLPPGEFPFELEAIIKGDTKIPAISAASIIAKVTRDRIMKKCHTKWPEYGFTRHKGYGTKQHFAVALELGPCPIHRTSFRPFANKPSKPLRP